MATPTPVTVDDLLRRLGRDADPNEQAEMLSVLIASTEAAEEWKNTGPIVNRSVTERVEANERGHVVLLKRPVQSVTSLTPTDGSPAILTAALEWDMWSAIVGGKTTSLDGKYDAVYVAGRGAVGAVPERFERAVLEIAAHNWETQMGPRTRSFVGSADESAGGGFRVGSGYLIPNRAATMLGGGRVFAL